MSTNFGHSLGTLKCCYDRDRYLVSHSEGHAVLHLGCANAESIDSRLPKGNMLHLRLLKAARKVVGVDIDELSIDKLRARGINDLHVADIEEADFSAFASDCDLVIAGEVLEHLQNPGRAMARVRDLLSSSSGTFIITVPNAFGFHNILSVALKRYELVLATHNAYYSPTTIREFIGRCGFRVLEMQMFTTVPTGSYVKRLLKSLYSRTFLKFFPFLAEGIIVRCAV